MSEQNIQTISEPVIFSLSQVFFKLAQGSLLLFALALPFSKAALSISYGVASICFLILLFQRRIEVSKIFGKLRDLGAPIFIFLLYGLISLSWGSHFVINVEGFFKFFRGFFLIILIGFFFQEKKIRLSLYSFLIFGAILSSIFGLIEHGMSWNFLKGYAFRGRIQSGFSDPNTYSVYLAMVLPLSYFVLNTFHHHKLKIAYFFLILLCFYNLYFSFTRVTLFFFGATSILLFLLISKRTYFQKVIISMVLVGAFSFLHPPRGFSIFQTLRAITKDTSMLERVYLWKIGFRMIEEKPILGHGLNSYGQIHTAYFPKNVIDMPYSAYYLYGAYPHNEYIKLWIEIGIVGLLLYLGIYLKLYEVALGGIKSKTSEEKFKICLFLISISTFIFSSFFDTHLAATQSRFTFWLVVSLMLSELQD